MPIHVITPTPSIENSLSFYQKLNFHVVPNIEEHYVTDGKVLIEIDPNRYIRAGIRMYDVDIAAITEAIQPYAKLLKTDDGAQFTTPSGTYVYLHEKPSSYTLEPSEAPFSTLGNFAGLSLETSDLERSVKIWEALGFSHTSGAIEQGWITLTHHEGLGVSLMPPNTCPHLFFNPSLTYFNSGKNLEVIEQIRLQNVPITEEITEFNKEGIVDNIIIRDPGGYGFFVFND